jgi:amino acid adenylation domain-containing protein
VPVTVDATPPQYLHLLSAQHPLEPAIGVVARLVRFRPEVHARQLQSAWSDVLRRYAGLRVRFAHDDALVQQLRSYDELPERTRTVRLVDEAQAALGVADHQISAFGPVLLDATARGAGDRVGSLLIRFHHALLDEVSLIEVVRVLAQHARGLLSALLVGDEADYRAAVRAVSSAAGGSGDSAPYWRDLFHPRPDVPRLGWPGDGGVGDAGLGDAGRYQRRVQPAELEQLRTGARAANVSLPILAHAALVTVLHRYGLGRRVAVGTPISLRDHPGIGFSVVGLFANVLPVVIDVRPDDALRDVLARTRARLVDLQAHKHTPLAQIPNLAGVPRADVTASDTTFFGMVLAVHAGARVDAALGVSIETVPASQPGALLALDLVDNGDDGQVTVTWRASACPWPSADRLVADLLRVMRLMCEKPNATVDTADLLNADDPPGADHSAPEQRLALSAPASQNLEAATESVHAAIRRVGQQRPDAQAVVDGDRGWRYADLMAAVASARTVVRSWWLPRGSRVAVAFGRSPWQIVSALALWEEGLCYVPVDCRGPVERTRYILCDAGVEHVLTDDSAGHLGCSVTGSAALKEQDPTGEYPSAAARPAEPAYVMYTSGTSGQPKGVVVTHRNLATFFRAVTAALPAARRGRWLAETTPTFDISMLELFWPLTHGQAVVLAGPDDSATVPGRPHGFDHRQCTPSRARQLLNARALNQPFGHWDVAPRTWLIGGETLPAALARDLRAAYPTTMFVNMYGPTEATVWSTAHVVTGPVGTEVPLGTPLDNTVVAVVDASGNPVPPGVVGELVIAGTGVAAGYLNRPDLTARAFIQVAWGSTDPLPAYRTGDFAVIGPDRLLYFRGRRDGQVKLRGHRIELAEVERALMAQPAIVDAVAVHVDGGADAGEGQIIAAVAARPGSHVEASALRRRLTEQVPDVMIPTKILVFPALPQLANGKIDRVRVQRMCTDAASAPADEHPAGPVADNPAATVLAEVARGILGCDVGPDDDFFALGGNSMTALRLVAEAYHRGVELNLHDVLRGGTLGRVAEHARVADRPTGTPSRR